MGEFRDSFSQQQAYNNAFDAYRQSLGASLADSAREYEEKKAKADEKLNQIKEGVEAVAGPFLEEGIKGGVRNIKSRVFREGKKLGEKGLAKASELIDKGLNKAIGRQVGEEVTQGGVTQLGELVKSGMGKIGSARQSYESNLFNILPAEREKSLQGFEELKSTRGVTGLDQSVNRIGNTADALARGGNAEEPVRGPDALDDITNGLDRRLAKYFDEFGTIDKERNFFENPAFAPPLEEEERPMESRYEHREDEQPEEELEDSAPAHDITHPNTALGMETDPIANKSDSLTNEDINNKVGGVAKDEESDALAGAIDDTEEDISKQAASKLANVGEQAASKASKIGAGIAEGLETDAELGGPENPLGDLVALGVGLAGIFGGIFSKGDEPSKPHIPRPLNPVVTQI